MRQFVIHSCNYVYDDPFQKTQFFFPLSLYTVQCCKSTCLFVAVGSRQRKVFIRPDAQYQVAWTHGSYGTFFLSCKANARVNLAKTGHGPHSHKLLCFSTRVGTLIVATIYLQLIQNIYMFRSFTVLQCSHQHCVQPVISDVEVVGYLQQRLLC